MTDVLAERCAAFADIAIELMRASMDALGAPHKLPEVARLVPQMQAVLELGTDGITNRAYLDWAAGADLTLNEMAEAADRKDSKAAWAAFAHPTRGLAALGQACAGYPRW